VRIRNLHDAAHRPAARRRRLEQGPEVPFGNAFAPANRAWITNDRTEAGHIGNPASASAEKGETIFRVFAADVVKFSNACWPGTASRGRDDEG